MTKRKPNTHVLNFDSFNPQTAPPEILGGAKQTIVLKCAALQIEREAVPTKQAKLFSSDGRPESRRNRSTLTTSHDKHVLIGTQPLH
jgi:hypothetical protein